MGIHTTSILIILTLYKMKTVIMMTLLSLASARNLQQNQILPTQVEIDKNDSDAISVYYDPFTGQSIKINPGATLHPSVTIIPFTTSRTTTTTTTTITTTSTTSLKSKNPEPKNLATDSSLLNAADSTTNEQPAYIDRI